MVDGELRETTVLTAPWEAVRSIVQASRVRLSGRVDPYIGWQLRSDCKRLLSHPLFCKGKKRATRRVILMMLLLLLCCCCWINNERMRDDSVCSPLFCLRPRRCLSCLSG